MTRTHDDTPQKTDLLHATKTDSSSVLPRVQLLWRWLPGEGARLELCWWAWLLSGALLVLAVVGLATLVLHGANQFPRFRAVLENERRNYLHVWVTACGSGAVLQPPELVPCAEAQWRAHIDVRNLALEQTVLHVLNDIEDGATTVLRLFNPLRWLSCTADSTCHYVVWKCVDTFFSSLWVMALAGFAAVVLLALVIWRGPWQVLLRRRKRWLAQEVLAQQKNSTGNRGVPSEALALDQHEGLRARACATNEGEQ